MRGKMYTGKKQLWNFHVQVRGFITCITVADHLETSPVKTLIINLNTNNMKKITSVLLTMVSALIFTACGNDRSTSTDTSTTSTMNTDTAAGNTNIGTGSMTGDTAMGSTATTGTTGAGPDLSGTQGPTAFAATAASGGMMEVDLGNLAT